jgi:hypothetical protein
MSYTGYLRKRLIAPIILHRVLKWLVNDELETMSRDTNVAKFEAASRQMFGGTEENHEEPHLR